MLIISDKDKQFIREHMEDAESIINAKKTNDALDLISGWMASYAFDENDDITDLGREAERVYDRIYDAN